MGCQRLMVLTAFLLFAKDNAVSAQYCASVVECLPQPTATIARPIVQSGAQYILPAVIQPIFAGYDSYAPDLFGYANYGNAPAPYPALPPIIIEEDNNLWQQLLYFLIFALKNKRENGAFTAPSFNGGCSCNCGCNCNSGCSCSCSNCKSSDSSTPTYIPIPIAIPVFTSSEGIPYIDSFSGLCDDNNIYIQGPSVQATNGKEPNEIINLIIRSEK